MITIQGKGVSTGIGMGPLYFYRRNKAEIKKYNVEDAQAEWLRFKGAQAQPHSLLCVTLFLSTGVQESQRRTAPMIPTFTSSATKQG